MIRGKRWMGVFARGMAMGVAEVVPGVSGGTIAFVTGIYEELVTSLAQFRPASLGEALRDPRGFWRTHNLGFLLCLVAGMLTAVLLFARALVHALEMTPTVVWGFFFGLIAASVVMIGRARSVRLLGSIGVLGVVLGFLSTRIVPGNLDATLAIYFIGGALAVCAWILPAVSGSFLLLVIGIYQPVLTAVSHFDFLVIGVFVLGCLVGLMSFSRLLNYLMMRVREPLLALLTGFMAGAAVRLWPWQFQETLYAPDAWAAATGEPARAVATLMAMVAGIFGIWMLSRLEH
ncbi:MAG: DUF368 domain-containing protein [Pseudomonadales bacterium]|jgi:putative membrane protein|nr:DUF368 domain-containing protein [Pseudomonadales bacterium]MDP6471720.1 DUF368 domain-containing protein [Pseudomonadales bacterium]MDP6971448.1 DUF368 domain-containing protein [Pseudomonadales bacterium]|tara:strand:- start:1891 stop:2757 length:867 start_codon:yes stop_codon:yes gene_type:complete